METTVAAVTETPLQDTPDLTELGISVWGAHQEVLEQQALNELDIFARENKKDNVNDDLEEGEIPENNVEKQLDLVSYLKSQEDLKKRQVFHRSLGNKHKRFKKEIEDVTEPEEDLKEDKHENSGSEYAPSEGEEIDSDYEPSPSDISPPRKARKLKKAERITRAKDDGVWECYKSRLKEYYKQAENDLSQKNNEDDIQLKGGLKVSLNIWEKLYGYQQDGVKWLWKIHRKATGGILGDEMGLGKTVQIIAFLHSLEYSRIISCHGRFNGVGPSLIVCPATVIHQWVQHFHEWAPEFRVVALHQSGSFQGDKLQLIKDVHKSKGILITTYSGVLKYKLALFDYNWHYLILDEGHKIRNPTAKVTTTLKHIRTPHRLMLTGSPMQNNLIELWSLFDFTNPGMLGNQTTFQEHFAHPILCGGFVNSTPIQEATALSVATTLKDLITPFLLRRSKVEVKDHIALPDKSEQVLFCSLTKEQLSIYKDFLMTDEVNRLLGKGVKNWCSDNQMRSNVLIAITHLRKICNHPDIFLMENNKKDDKLLINDENFGYYKKSGKMVVVSALLKIWKKQGHRVLLFTQSRFMITIFQNFLNQQNYKYLKMDGTTPISSRQPLIDKFNTDASYDVFLLTTRVGGLGINLTGANRVIIYDPDWNPATDTQARERAWRIGQNKQVTIYRLLSAGTIEEKIYQRQVWKQLLSNKVLLDPKTSRFFKSSDLYDIFSLQESDLETANIFHKSRVRIQENLRKSKSKKTETTENSPGGSKIQFSDDKIQSMKLLAQQIAKSITPPKKSLFQIELEDEHQQRQQEKEMLKNLTPNSLLQYNRDKLTSIEDLSVNKIDDSEAKVGFSEALQYVEETAKLHHELIKNKNVKPEKIVEKAREIRVNVTKKNVYNPLEKYKKRKDVKEKVKVDNSGIIDGEVVDGLVKREVKKVKRKEKSYDSGEQHDDFVLGKLFQKKGVSGALQHDSIVQNSSQGGNLRIHTEAKFRAEKSLEALRKSRLENWRW